MAGRPRASTRGDGKPLFYSLSPIVSDRRHDSITHMGRIGANTASGRHFRFGLSPPTERESLRGKAGCNHAALRWVLRSYLLSIRSDAERVGGAFEADRAEPSTEPNRWLPPSDASPSNWKQRSRVSGEEQDYVRGRCPCVPTWPVVVAIWRRRGSALTVIQRHGLVAGDPWIGDDHLLRRIWHHDSCRVQRRERPSRHG